MIGPVPIYEYLCEGCGLISEVMQKMSDPPPRTCPECGSRKIAKLVSRSAFQLKGGGWYSDLYASSKKDAKTGDAAKAGDGAAKADKTEAKPAAVAGADTPAAADPAPAKKPDKAPAKKARS